MEEGGGGGCLFFFWVGIGAKTWVACFPPLIHEGSPFTELCFGKTWFVFVGVRVCVCVGGGGGWGGGLFQE